MQPAAGTEYDRSPLNMSVIHPWYKLGYVIPHAYTDMDAYQFYGIEVIANCSRGSSLEKHKMADPAADHQLALDLGAEAMRAAPKAQAVLMPGGLWHAMHAVPLLEAEYGRPVLLNIVSTTWAALNAAGARMQHRPNPRCSKLLASL
jgi:maleate cis-trans isomerase